MIPDHFHFIFGLKDQTEPFHLAWYLCLKSCRVVNQPEEIFFHYYHEPYGPWWDKIKSELTLVKLAEVETGFDVQRYNDHDEGRFIRQAGLQYAHQADFLRLQILLNRGGVYADIDTLFVSPYPPELYESACVLGQEQNDLNTETLCNAVIMAAPGSKFIEKWLHRMTEVFDGTWNRHSCLEAASLSEKMPQDVKVVSSTLFFHFPYTKPGLVSLFGSTNNYPAELCSIHMWSHLWWQPWRTDFMQFHEGLLTEKFIREVDTTYNLVARRFLD